MKEDATAYGDPEKLGGGVNLKQAGNWKRKCRLLMAVLVITLLIFESSLLSFSNKADVCTGGGSQSLIGESSSGVSKWSDPEPRGSNGGMVRDEGCCS